MSQKELLHEKKQFAASVQKPNYTEPLKIAKLLQLETWPACKNPAKCQVPTVRFKPDITLVVEEVQVDRGVVMVMEMEGMMMVMMGWWW